MIYRRFGKTGLSMPLLSFGCMRSMHGWQDKPLAEVPSQATADLESILIRALEHGINHIETASGYGTSERQLGAILPKLPRKSYILQTKAPPSKDPEQFLRKVEKSMRRLQTNRLDLLAIHGINDHRSLWYSVRKGGCLAAARELQRRGIVDHIGFSGHGPCDVIIEALEHEEDGGFDYFNVHWYYILNANKEAIECATARDIGTFIISPSDKGGYLHTPSRKLQTLCEPLSPMLFNDIYCLQQEGVHTISVGASSPDHFDEHLKALPFLESNSHHIVKKIANQLGQAMRDICGNPQPDHLWHELPPWEQSPGNINLRLISWLYNLYRAWDMKAYARDRYAMLGTGSAWVAGNNGRFAQELDFSGLNTLKNINYHQLKQLIVDAHSLLAKKNKLM